MSDNSVILYDLVEAVREYLAALAELDFAAEIVTQYDYRHTDEERDGVLGQWLPVPAVIVSGEIEESTLQSLCRVKVVVRHSQEESTMAEHQANSKMVVDALMALPTITATGRDFGFLPMTFDGPIFERSGRALETTISARMVPL